jgi:predicted nucleic acid-binding protein
VHSFEGRLFAPPEVVVETSFIVDALVATQPRHEPCRVFLNAIADTGTIVYFTTLVVAEL